MTIQCFISSRIVVVFLFLLPIQSSAAESKGFAGQWETTYGLMTLEQKDDSVSGQYIIDGASCTIGGKIQNRRLQFTYREPNASGEGWFELNANGDQFSGLWRENGSSVWMSWAGTRTKDLRNTFAGVWDTSFGRMRLLENDKGEVRGVYALDGVSTLQGKKNNDWLTLRYHEKNASGEARFRLKEEGSMFEGEWRADGQEQWQKWTGRRLPSTPGRVWLVVIEARWEKSLDDKEFALGEMLKAFFNRTPNVEVRHRFFTDAASLQRWLKEVAYFPEPTVVTIATHGTDDGLGVDGTTISANTVAEGLKYAANLKALHFSSCSVMKDKFGKEVFKALTEAGVRTAVSGYQNPVDWAASALFEMTYLDLLLSRGMNAPEASATALNMFPIAGKAPLKNVPILPGGFEILH
ncbi:MAG TPA: hypothetical protein VJ810_03490 [Blastocatellia bacterium]|nr:hypothetical protein [Blastocatellia bacterium]